MEFNERKSRPCCARCTWSRLRIWAWVSVFIGVAFVCVGWFLPPAIHNLVDSGINDSVLLTVSSAQNNDQVYRVFASYLDPDAPYVRYSVYMWNITNPDEILAGAKPVVQQVGPYVFREIKQRLNSTFFKDLNGHWVVDYYEWTYYIYEPTMTASNLDLYHDTFIVPNLVFWGIDGHNRTIVGVSSVMYVLALLQANATCPYVNVNEPAGDLLTDGTLEKCMLFQTKTANEFFFGFEDPILTSFNAGPFPGVIVNVTEEALAANPALALHNQIYTGEDDPSLSRQYKMYAGTTTVQYTTLTGTTLPLWGTDFANRVYGTDGTQFSRNPTPGGILPAYVAELYRAAQLENSNSERVQFKGIDLLRYRLSPLALLNETAYPDNAAFYLTESAVLNVSLPNQGAPILMTRPHCLYVNADICDLVVGQNPNPDLHDTYIDVEPNTGMTMHAGKRLQANFRPSALQILLPLHRQTWYAKINPDILIPMFWVEEYGEVPDNQADDFKNGVYMGQALAYYITYIVPIFGAFFIGLSTLLFHCAVNRAHVASKATSVQQPFLDTEPIHARSDYSAL